MLFDVFISHASEDKDDLVRPLSAALQQNRVEVWYDEFSLRAGNSLRRSIDFGLSKCRYGVVALSKNFFCKNRPQWELDGLLQRQNSEGRQLILPVWHGVTRADVLEYSRSLADKVAVENKQGLDHVVNELLKILQPEGSTLLIARDVLIQEPGCRIFTSMALRKKKWKRCLRILAKIAPGGTAQGSFSVKLALDALCESFTFVIRNRTVSLL